MISNNNSTYVNSLCFLLASSSQYRAQLLAKLDINFEQASPNIDETPIVHETSAKLVERLSEAKAIALLKDYPAHIIIACDQVAISPNGEILGKPLNRENAIRQLTLLNGHQVKFLTGLCVLTPESCINGYHANLIAGSKPIALLPTTSQKWIKQSIVEPFTVHFRNLSINEIANYIDKEQPFDCAGSFKSEGLGISLFEKLEGDDPNSLVGLPLIQLCKLLKNVGINVLG